MRTESKFIFRISTQLKEWTETASSRKSSKCEHGAILHYFDINSNNFMQNEMVVMHNCKLQHKL